MSSQSTPGSASVRGEAPRRSSALPLIGESVGPWIGAAVVMAVVDLALVVAGRPLSIVEQSLVLVALCATVAAGALVSVRSNQALQVLIDEERARPAIEELIDAPPARSSAGYASGMAQWATALLELIDHAASVAEPGSSVHAELVAAGSEARDLRALFCADPAEALSVNDRAKLHALGSLWETSHLRLEHLAAELDPMFHRRWRARSVVARRLRHGHDLPRPLVLPYRS